MPPVVAARPRAAEHRLVVGQVEVRRAEQPSFSSSGPSLRFSFAATDPAEVVAAVLEEGVAEVGLADSTDGGSPGRARQISTRASSWVGAMSRSFSHWPSRKSKWLTKRSRKPGSFSSS